MGSEKHIMPGVYQHNKSGNRYLVLGSSLHTESGEIEVFYKPLYECEHRCFHRPINMFLETVEIKGKQTKRFSLIKENHRVYTPIDVQKINPNKDDVVVINLPASMKTTPEMTKALQEGMEKVFPNNEIVFLPRGVTLKTEKK